MPSDSEDRVRGQHPPDCTCFACAKKRRESLRDAEEPLSSARRMPLGAREPKAAGERLAGYRLSDILPKVGLNLVILAGLGALVRYGYLLFTHELGPLRGSILFILGIAAWVGVIWLVRRRYRYAPPGFVLTTSLTVAVLLIMTFAGVEPLAAFKDNLLGKERPTAPAALAAPPPPSSPEAPPPTETPEALSLFEKDVFDLINNQRYYVGVPRTRWDDSLYAASKGHTQNMANQGQPSHSPEGGPYWENVFFMAQGYERYTNKELAKLIGEAWVASPIHKAWLLHEPLEHSAVSIVKTQKSVFVSWTIWTSEVGERPFTVTKAEGEWMQETGGATPWSEWLIKKGYFGANPALVW
ncbi:MAG: hypothetical protein HW414_37 [Dehalococcoidia bacterium]|nr:hypothetical protein [Dehalococcoidia bacterium]